MLAALIAPVVFATPELMVRMPIGAPPPTAEESVIDPVPAVRDRLLPPSTVPETSILPAPAPVLREEAPVKVIIFVRVRLASAVVMVPLRWTAPPPLWINVAAELIVPPIV